MRCALVILVLVSAHTAHAMCGCMLRPQPRVGEVKGAKIVNKTSKVILARDGDTTVLTMANDFEGAPAEFGMVVPVPTVIKKEDVRIVDDKVFDALEDATAPRVVEIIEPDPCMVMPMEPSVAMESKSAVAAPGRGGLRAADYGVKVEAHFFAGEYEIAVLSGKNGNGLVEWLQKFHYDVPDDAKEILTTYIKQKMMFFLARVYVKEMGNQRRHLRPIQVRYTTPKLMLPIRLGMVNADGPQEILLFALTHTGRVESTNYRTVKMPSGVNLPWFAKNEWNDVYGAIFDEQEKREDMRVIFEETMQPVASDPKSGAFWGGPVYASRMHFRYANATFPEDLVLQVTTDTAPFAVSMNAIKPAVSSCGADPGARARRDGEQQSLANLTGWPIEKVREKVGAKAGGDDKWYERLWK